MTTSIHSTEVVTLPEGYQLVCTCGHTGRVRASKFDAGEDEIAHQHTGGGPRTLDEIREAEERRRQDRGILGQVRRLLRL